MSRSHQFTSQKMSSKRLVLQLRRTNRVYEQGERGIQVIVVDVLPSVFFDIHIPLLTITKNDIIAFL